MFKTTLSVKERLNFAAAIPENGDVTSMRIRHGLIEKVALTDEEIRNWNVRTEDGRSYRWNAEIAKDVEFEFTEPELAAIRLKLRQLNDQKALNDYTFGFWEKFMPEEEGAEKE